MIAALPDAIEPYWTNTPPPGLPIHALEDYLTGGPFHMEVQAWRHRTPTCARAAASMAGKPLIAALVAAPACLALRSIALRPDCGARLSQEPGRALRLVIQERDLLPAGDCASALFPWIGAQVAPAVVLMARQGGLAPRVLWSNTATLLAWVVEATGLEGDPALLTTLFGPGSRPGLPDGNPLAGHVRYLPTGLSCPPRIRRRRCCCLRDRIGMSLCFCCPKLPVPDGVSILAADCLD
jgi:hypothetical protein